MALVCVVSLSVSRERGRRVVVRRPPFPTGAYILYLVSGLWRAGPWRQGCRNLRACEVGDGALPSTSTPCGSRARPAPEVKTKRHRHGCALRSISSPVTFVHECIRRVKYGKLLHCKFLYTSGVCLAGTLRAPRAPIGSFISQVLASHTLKKSRIVRGTNKRAAANRQPARAYTTGRSTSGSGPSSPY